MSNFRWLLGCEQAREREGKGELATMSQEFDSKKSMQNADWWILNLVRTSLLFACVVLTIQKWWKAEFLFVKVARIPRNNLYKFSLELRPKQRQAANALLQSSDVLAVLSRDLVQV